MSTNNHLNSNQKSQTLYSLSNNKAKVTTTNPYLHGRGK